MMSTFWATQLAMRTSCPVLRSSRRIPSSFCFGRKALTAVCRPLDTSKKNVLVIAGPTGAGKSMLALEVARRLGGEIISTDLVQVYRGLDIGSAKPSISEMNMVPHHLIDILHASEDYSVGQFFDDARRATEDVLDRGRVPIVARGTPPSS